MIRKLVPALLVAAALPAAAQVAAPAPAASPSAPHAAAAPMPADAILADDGVVRVTRADYDLELLKLSPDIRGGFATTERRVAELVTRLFVTRSLAGEADVSGLTREPLNAAKLAAELEKAKAQLRVAQIEAAAAEKFERERAAWEKRASDVYVTQPGRFTMPEQVSASHILFRTDKHGAEGATKLAKDTREKIVAGASFGKLAAELSEDYEGRRAMGKLPVFGRGQMDPDFERAAWALKKGELSEPVTTQFGVHLIFVHEHLPERKQSFDQAKPRIMADLRQQFIANERDAALNALQDRARSYVNMDLVSTMVIATPPEDDLVRRQREAVQRGGARRSK